MYSLFRENERSNEIQIGLNHEINQNFTKWILFIIMNNNTRNHLNADYGSLTISLIRILCARLKLDKKFYYFHAFVYIDSKFKMASTNHTLV